VVIFSLKNFQNLMNRSCLKMKNYFHLTLMEEEKCFWMVNLKQVQFFAGEQDWIVVLLADVAQVQIFEELLVVAVVVAAVQFLVQIVAAAELYAAE
jgi:hypothetical protein